MIKGLLFSALILASCTSNIRLKKVNYGSLLHNDNSKVWLINRQIVNNININNGHNWYKELMIFHSNGVVEIISMQDLGKKLPKKGHYYLNSDKKLLEISFTGKNGIENWNMELTSLTEESIFMRPTKDSDTEISLQIIPFPELI
jgi:hypothetical protein